jgi:hypothetical protein
MRKLSLGALSALVLVAAGCGGGGSYANTPRPPVSVTVTAAIRTDGVVISPSKLGAGPIVLIATNETGTPQTLTVSQDTSGTSDRAASTGPINPQGVGQVKIDLVQGRYTIRPSGATKPAILRVGKLRPSAQNELLQP